MLAVFVYVRVFTDKIEAFREATLENARHSILESAVARFDVVQNREKPEEFVLIEVYREANAPAAHKATSHYARWRDAVAPMMAEPRRSVAYETVSAFGVGG